MCKEVELDCDWINESGRLTSVTWKRADQDLLLQIKISQNDVVFPDPPDHRFQFTDTQKANLSLKLMDVTTEDEKAYMYKVHTNEKSKTCTVALQVCK